MDSAPAPAQFLAEASRRLSSQAGAGCSLLAAPCSGPASGRKKGQLGELRPRRVSDGQCSAPPSAKHALVETARRSSPAARAPPSLCAAGRPRPEPAPPAQGGQGGRNGGKGNPLSGHVSRTSPPASFCPGMQGPAGCTCAAAAVTASECESLPATRTPTHQPSAHARAHAYTARPNGMEGRAPYN